MYFDGSFKKLIKKQGETFDELKELLDQYSDFPAIKELTSDIDLSQALDNYLLEMLIELSRVSSGVDLREIEFVSILLDKNLTKEAMEYQRGDKIKMDLHDPNPFVLLYQVDKSITVALINAIEAIGLTFIAVDGKADIPEIKALTAIIFEIRYAIRSLDSNSSMSIPSSTKPIESTKVATKDTNSDPKEDLESILSKLNELIGLEKIKEEISALINLIKVRKLREEHKLPMKPMSFHLVFSGNPGTGKTTVARILAKIYKNLGVLSKGDLVEVDRSGLVAGFVGQTAIKTKEVIDSAKGGLLFIDEAYSLTPGGSHTDYGSEAIEVLLKSMEDQRGDLVVIVAGYTDEMEEFLSSNPGLKSRFNKFIHFADYTPQELFDIFLLMSGKQAYILDDDAKDKLKDTISQIYDARTENFANARIIRNMFESTIQNQANRVITIKEPTKEDLQMVSVEDIKLLDAEYINS
jgi:SpoVK/Ycf46/Vps4 family AAA+-type ATPase